MSDEGVDSVAQVLRAASRTIALRGVKAATVDAIATEAGVARATIYRNFEGRDGVMNAVVEYEFRRFFTELYDAVAKESTIDAVLEKGLVFAHAAVSRHSLLQIVLREDPSLLEPAFSASSREIEASIAELFTPYLPKSPHRAEQADVLARLGLDYISTQGRWNLESRGEVRQLVQAELLAGIRERSRRVAPARVAPLFPVADGSLRTEVIDATLRVVAEGGYRRFSLDQLVQELGVSRATIYRAVPGGNAAVLEAAVGREASRFFSATSAALAQESDLHRGMLAALTTVWHHLATHAALSGVLRSDPTVILNRLRFEQAEATYFQVSSLFEPLLEKWMPRSQAGRLAELLCRVAVMYWLNPAPYLDVTDPTSVATFYGRHLAAAVEHLAE